MEKLHEYNGQTTKERSQQFDFVIYSRNDKIYLDWD